MQSQITCFSLGYCKETWTAPKENAARQRWKEGSLKLKEGGGSLRPPPACAPKDNLENPLQSKLDEPRVPCGQDFPERSPRGQTVLRVAEIDIVEQIKVLVSELDLPTTRQQGKQPHSNIPLRISDGYEICRSFGFAVCCQTRIVVPTWPYNDVSGNRDRCEHCLFSIFQIGLHERRDSISKHRASGLIGSGYQPSLLFEQAGIARLVDHQGRAS